MDLDKEKERIQKLFADMDGCECKGIVAFSNREGTRFYTQACTQTVHQCMMDVARRLAWLPASMPEIVEGHPLIQSSSPEINELASKAFLRLPESCQSIVIILSDKGDSVFCIGEPSMLTYLALRTCVTIEQASAQSFGGMNN